MSNDTKETFTQQDILEALQEVEDRLAGIQYLLEKAGIPTIEVDKADLAMAARSAKRVRRGC